MASVCDDLTGDKDAAEFWNRAFRAYPQLKDTKLNAIATAFTCAGHLIMDDLYGLDEADMQEILEAAKEPVKFSNMLIRLMGSRYKGIVLQLRQQPSQTLGLAAQSNTPSGGAMVTRFQSSPGAPLPAPALTPNPELTAPVAPVQLPMAGRRRSARSLRPTSGWARWPSWLHARSSSRTCALSSPGSRTATR